MIYNQIVTWTAFAILAMCSFVTRISNLSVHARLMLGAGKTPVATQLRMIMSSSDEVEVNSREDGGTKQRNGSVNWQP